MLTVIIRNNNLLLVLQFILHEIYHKEYKKHYPWRQSKVSNLETMTHFSAKCYLYSSIDLPSITYGF